MTDTTTPSSPGSTDVQVSFPLSRFLVNSPGLYVGSGLDSRTDNEGRKLGEEREAILFEVYERDLPEDPDAPRPALKKRFALPPAMGPLTLDAFKDAAQKVKQQGQVDHSWKLGFRHRLSLHSRADEEGNTFRALTLLREPPSAEWRERTGNPRRIGASSEAAVDGPEKPWTFWMPTSVLDVLIDHLAKTNLLLQPWVAQDKLQQQQRRRRQTSCNKQQLQVEVRSEAGEAVVSAAAQ